MANSRELILGKIKQALTSSVPVPFEDNINGDQLFHPSTKDLEIEFAENFTKLLGMFVYCISPEEMAENLDQLLAARGWINCYCAEPELSKQLKQMGFDNFNYTDIASCDVAVTSCECLIARTGSLVLSAAQENGRTASVYAPIHICIAYTNQLVFDIKDGLSLLKAKYKKSLPSLITLATGPSRTADIEKTLVVGVHGPKEVFCFLVER